MSAPALEVVRVSRVIAASPERLFEAWTTPDQLKQWWGRLGDAEVDNVEMDVRVGGAYRIEGAGFGGWAISGTYREVAPVDRLVYTFGWERPLIEATDTGETLVSVAFIPVDEGTEVSIVHELLRGPRVAEFHDWGWKDSLRRLTALVGADSSP